MKKVIDNNKTEMKIETINDNQEKQQKVWKNFGHFDNAPITLWIRKGNLPENALFYINQGYQGEKNNKKVHYTDIYIFGKFWLMNISLKI